MSNFLICDPPCVFIHIPRTGGMSVRKGLFGGRYLGPKHGWFPAEWDLHFKFAFVRNPFDRLVSAWQLFTKGSDQPLPFEPRPDMTLREFLDIATDETVTYDLRERTFESAVRHHTIAQTHSFNCLDEADYIGRYETLTKDVGAICSRLDIECRMPHLNGTRHDEYRKYFDAKTRGIAERLYRDDLAQLGYAF